MNGDEQRVAVGLAIVAQREEEMFFDILKAQIVDWRMAESLLARAELEDAIRRRGGLRDHRGRCALFDRLPAGPARAYLFGFQGWLAHELGQRFANLMSKRSVAQRLILFTREQITPLLGKNAAHRVAAPAPAGPDRERHAGAEPAISPVRNGCRKATWAAWRELERIRYRDMLEQFLISGGCTPT